jgi:hypothetical protein
MKHKNKYFPVILFFSILAAIIMPLLPPVSPAFAESSHIWTTQADFDAGVLNQVDTSSSPGDVILATDVDTGNGGFNDLEVSGIYYTDSNRSAISQQSSAGTNRVYVDSTGSFNPDFEVLIIQMTGINAGLWETAFIQSLESGYLVLKSNLVNT